MDRQRHALLIVEDHEPTRRILARLLTRDGWEVHTASTIAEGLDLLSLKPECIVLDLMLPDGGGETVLRRVREDHMASRVAVTTGEGNEERLEAVRRLGPDALLRKPVPFDELCRVCDGAPMA